MKKLNVLDFFKAPANAILTILGILTGPVLVLMDIFTLWFGIAVTLSIFLILTFSAFINCYHQHNNFITEVEKLKKNRDGLIEVKQRYLKENESLRKEICHLKHDKMILQQNNTNILLNIFLNSDSIPENLKDILAHQLADQTAGGVENDREENF